AGSSSLGRVARADVSDEGGGERERPRGAALAGDRADPRLLAGARAVVEADELRIAVGGERLRERLVIPGVAGGHRVANRQVRPRLARDAPLPQVNSPRKARTTWCGPASKFANGSPALPLMVTFANHPNSGAVSRKTAKPAAFSFTCSLFCVKVSVSRLKLIA